MNMNILLAQSTFPNLQIHNQSIHNNHPYNFMHSVVGISLKSVNVYATIMF